VLDKIEIYGTISIKRLIEKDDDHVQPRG
jgi:hypothetical protein